MKIIDFDVNKFNNLKDKKWMLGNNILYKMCSDHPSHKDPEEIRAKIWLIGRSYAVAIERRIKNRHMQNDDFYDYVINEFIKFNKQNKFDSKLQFLRNKEFNENTFKEILTIHHQLTQFFKVLTGKEKRSLASKYLHFHIPIFPIYDSRAKKSINKIVKGSIDNPDKFIDKEYSIFCNKILFLNNYIKDNTGKIPTLREIDAFLVQRANDLLRKRKNLE